MGNRPEWNEWILQKNAEAEAEELRKNDSTITYEELEKAAEQSGVFHMDHVNEVVGLPHSAAKTRANQIVDASTANPKNKAKIKLMIGQSKNSKHLALGMSNHILAHPEKNEDGERSSLSVIGSKRS